MVGPTVVVAGSPWLHPSGGQGDIPLPWPPLAVAGSARGQEASAWRPHVPGKTARGKGIDNTRRNPYLLTRPAGPPKNCGGRCVDGDDDG